jgi:hypothetical protein
MTGENANDSMIGPTFITRGVLMDPKHGFIFSERVGSHQLLLHMVRCVVEKHGGSITLDEKTNSLILSIPESKKTACFQELEQTLGPSKPINEISPIVH